MAAFGSNYNPSSVMMRRGPGSVGPITSGPYVNAGPSAPGPMPSPPRTKPQPNPPLFSGMPAQTSVPAAPPAPASTTVGPESIRATGAGPFDQAYRQNLASYAGGQFARPGGSMSFNPTNPATFPGMATGGGTAPVAGMPQTLLDMALQGQGFAWQPPQPAQPANPPPAYGNMQFWLDQFMRGGRGGRQASAL